MPVDNDVKFELRKDGTLQARGDDGTTWEFRPSNTGSHDNLHLVQNYIKLLDEDDASG